MQLPKWADLLAVTTDYALGRTKRLRRLGGAPRIPTSLSNVLKHATEQTQRHHIPTSPPAALAKATSGDSRAESRAWVYA